MAEELCGQTVLTTLLPFDLDLQGDGAMTRRRKQALWTVVIYVGVTIGLTVTFWLDPLHDGWSNWALAYGPLFGLMTVCVTELFFQVQTLWFGRDVVSEWFDKHVGTWSEPPSSGSSRNLRRIN